VEFRPRQEGNTLHLIWRRKKTPVEQEKTSTAEISGSASTRRRTDSVTQHSAVGTQPSAKSA